MKRNTVLDPDVDWRRYLAGDRIRGRDLGNGRAKMNSASHNYLFLGFDFPFPPNDLPSNPGRLFPFRRSVFMAILSARFFCRAAIDVAACSFRSCLQQCDFREITSGFRKVFTYHLFWLFSLSFSFLFAAFLSRTSSSLTFTPSMRASAFSHFSCSSIAFLFSSGMAANFSLRAASWPRANDGFDVVVRFFDFLLDDGSATAENETLVTPVTGSGTRSWFCGESVISARLRWPKASPDLRSRNFGLMTFLVPLAVFLFLSLPLQSYFLFGLFPAPVPHQTPLLASLFQQFVFGLRLGPHLVPP